MLLLILATLLLVFGAHAWRKNLCVGVVVVRGTKIVSIPSVVSLAGIVKGQQLFGVDLGAVKRRIEQNPFVAVASVKRDAPDRITIDIIEREPIATVIVDHPVYIDAEGVVLPAVRSDHVFDLPVITGAVPVGECLPGKRVSSLVMRGAVALLMTAKAISDEAYRRISEIRLGDQRDLVLYTAEYGIPVIMDSGDVAAGLLKLDSFWKGVVNRRGADALEYVDLRFKDQIVVRWNSERGRAGD